MDRVFTWFVHQVRERSAWAQWEILKWDALSQSLDEFHAKLFYEVVERDRQVSGRLRLAVIVSSFDTIDEQLQQNYRRFPQQTCYPGFKSSLVIPKPAGLEYPDFPADCSGIGFGDLQLVFVTSSSRQCFEECDGTRPQLHG